MSKYRYLLISVNFSNALTAVVTVETSSIVSGHSAFGLITPDQDGIDTGFVANGSIDTSLTSLTLSNIGFTTGFLNGTTSAYSSRNNTAGYEVYRVEGLGKL